MTINIEPMETKRLVDMANSSQRTAGGIGGDIALLASILLRILREHDREEEYRAEQAELD